jgi:undecaprenyl-diphosphatase
VTDQILEIDRYILLVINGLGRENPALDTIMNALSGKWSAIPLYIFSLATFWKYHKANSLVWLAISTVSLVLLTDQGSVSLFKEIFQRLRPCHEPDLAFLLRLFQEKCGGQYGFVSSHSANTAGISAFIAFSLINNTKWFFTLFMWWTLVGFSRIYLGVHYPSDVVIGGIYGLLIGFSVSKIYRFAVLTDYKQ